MSRPRKTSFGIYRGSPVYLMHVATSETQEPFLQLPLICKMTSKPLPPHYYHFLERKVGEGYTSRHLVVGVDPAPAYTGAPGTAEYRRKAPRLLQILNAFKGVVRRYLARRIVRQKFRAAQIHEELVSVVWSPAAFQKRLDMGLSLDEVCDL